MALAFAAGSLCFLVGPFPGYLDLVGPEADALTFFVGSILFTIGGALQTNGSAPGADRWSSVIQSAGTLFFNATTFRALDTAVSNPQYDRLVWRPDALGAICFLVSGVIAYAASPRRGLRPARGPRGWWQPLVNLLGCVFFGIAAIAGYAVPSSGSILDLGAANFTTALGAACFFICAVATLRADRAHGAPAPAGSP